MTQSDPQRLLCHTLVDQLPPAALQEAVESLAGMVEFYRDRPAPPVPPAAQSVKAKITGTVTAKVYPITED